MPDGPRPDFDDFVRARSTGLLRVGYLLTGDRHEAEDLVQECSSRSTSSGAGSSAHPRRTRAAPW